MGIKSESIATLQQQLQIPIIIGKYIFDFTYGGLFSEFNYKGEWVLNYLLLLDIDGKRSLIIIIIASPLGGALLRAIRALPFQSNMQTNTYEGYYIQDRMIGYEMCQQAIKQNCALMSAPPLIDFRDALSARVCQPNNRSHQE